MLRLRERFDVHLDMQLGLESPGFCGQNLGRGESRQQSTGVGLLLSSSRKCPWL